VPIAKPLRESGDAGAPLVVSDPSDPAAVELRRAARKLLRRVSEESLTSLPMA
jgi:ATP-binding protein involved in chromosome partitioning